MSAAPLEEPEENPAFSRLPGTKIETKWVFVTPQMAEEFLATNEGNRTLREQHIDRLANDMRGERFYVSHQGLAFDEEGVLLDGQHRCYGIIRSGVGQWLLVTIGLPTITRRVIDMQSKRMAHDFMHGKYRPIRTTAIRIMLAIEYNNGVFTPSALGFGLQMITNTAVQEAWGDFDNIEELAGLAYEGAKLVDSVGSGGLLAAGLCYPDTALEFLTGIKLMTGLETGDPRLALLRYRGGTRRVQHNVASFLAIKAAKAFNEGRKITMLRSHSQERLTL